jgi:hypothetical protein
VIRATWTTWVIGCPINVQRTDRWTAEHLEDRGLRGERGARRGGAAPATNSRPTSIGQMSGTIVPAETARRTGRRSATEGGLTARIK